jgi:molecular chaperone DnaK (HSP70)
VLSYEHLLQAGLLLHWLGEAVHASTTALSARVLAAGLQASDISSVEVVGGSTRVPAVFNLVADVFGMTPSRTLNAKEVVSRGAALQCAMISPLIKVGGRRWLGLRVQSATSRWCSSM